MVDVVITPANVVAASDADIVFGTLGATVTAGQLVYLDTADNRYKLADADSATVLARVPKGFALNGGATGQPVAVQRAGNLTIGGTVAAGIVYLLGDVAGSVRPSVDAGAGDFTTVVGIGQSATVLKVGILAGGVAI